MGGDMENDLSDGFWDTDDEDETQKFPLLSSCINSKVALGKAITSNGEASTSAGPSNKACSSDSSLFSYFVSMGFSRDEIANAIEKNGEDTKDTDAILDTLLTYKALEESPPKKRDDLSDLSSESAGDIDDFSDMESDLENEGNMDPSKQNNLLKLENMGYSIDEALIAFERCGTDASLEELTDFIYAAQVVKADDAHLRPTSQSSSEEEFPKFSKEGKSHGFYPTNNKKRRLDERVERKQKKIRKIERKVIDEDDEAVHLPNPMIGFGVPGEPPSVFERSLPEAAIGPPYFYYENVAMAPKGVWKKMSSFLFDIEPEFVDSKFFSAAARKRGYIHNLPIDNRVPLFPKPPQTIHEAFPLTKKWWPWWDRRTKLNCLQTCTASAKLTERIRKALEECDGEPSLKVQKYVIYECKKWNLVWVGRNKVAPLEPDEIESLLGFPKNHTRGGGISRTERLKGLGNSFQIDTVAYHLSVLRNIFPNGLNVLSLFSGIGGAEVALHRLGIRLKNVVSVEISESSRNILRSWWESTNQTGNLIDINDVESVDKGKLEQLIHEIGGFDLIVGGSPCNNISGSNRVSRTGLEGKDSSLFYEYFRILNQVKDIMKKL